MDIRDLGRFESEQERSYPRALKEIRRGKKRTHWMWYIFPQLRGLGHSQRSFYFGIADREEAERYWANAVLRGRLVEITEAFLALPPQHPARVMGNTDAGKLRSCMTLFAEVAGDECPVFSQVLEKFYGGEADPVTLKMLNEGNENG